MNGVNFCTNTIHHVLNGFFFLTTTTQMFHVTKKYSFEKKARAIHSACIQVLTWHVSRTWLMKEMTIPSLTRQRQNVSRNCLLSENETVGSMNA